MYKWGSENWYKNHLSIWVSYEKPSSSYTVWCNMTGEATGEIWTWSLLGVKVFKSSITKAAQLLIYYFNLYQYWNNIAPYYQYWTIWISYDFLGIMLELGFGWGWEIENLLHRARYFPRPHRLQYLCQYTWRSSRLWLAQARLSSYSYYSSACSPNESSGSVRIAWDGPTGMSNH